MQTNLEQVLKNIYQNLIDEEDVIVEEESREGISQNTISEIQFKGHGSNQSNNTGNDIQKLVRLIKNSS